jgi:hypothetical protein
LLDDRRIRSRSRVHTSDLWITRRTYLFVRAEDQTLLYEETEAEVDSQRGKVEELVTLGRELVKGTSYLITYVARIKGGLV